MKNSNCLSKLFMLTFCVVLFFNSFGQTNNHLSKKRSDCFFGIHFDFHAGADCNEIGRNFSESLIDSFLTVVKPDFIQVDCKGHPGYSSYPTKVGNPAPGFIKDPMRIWRDVTAKNQVKLYVHYSGMVDGQACKLHPSWAACDSAGVPDKNITSSFGPYVDHLLIPQMKELITNYGIDGAWVDGDCWGVIMDYSPMAIKAYKKETGSENIPYKPEDPGYKNYMDFMRKGFRGYVNHYVNAVHQINPNFEIASNWAFSSMMPEAVSIPVDFLSGDLTPQNSANSAAFEARCIALQGKPWDLMTWGFSRDEKMSAYKSATQLKQEAAQVISMGGGFQAYFPQNRDASIKKWSLSTMKDLADFCKARQPYCFKAKPINQIALVHSQAGFIHQTKWVYSWQFDNLPSLGTLTALLDGQNTVEIGREYTLKGNLDKYPVIVYPEWEVIEEDFKKELIDYVKEGGNLLVIGSKTTKLFENELGVRFNGLSKKDSHNLFYKDQSSGIIASLQEVETPKGIQSFGVIEGTSNSPGASICNLGKGKIAGIYFDFGRTYQNYTTSVLREFMSDIINNLLPNPIIEVKGSHFVHVALNELNGKMMINLINTAGSHHDKNVFNFSEIPPVGPLTVAVRMSEKPKKMTLQPEGISLKFKYENNVVSFEVPRIEIHSIIEIEK